MGIRELTKKINALVRSDKAVHTSFGMGRKPSIFDRSKLAISKVRGNWAIHSIRSRAAHDAKIHEKNKKMMRDIAHNRLKQQLAASKQRPHSILHRLVNARVNRRIYGNRSRSRRRY